MTRHSSYTSVRWFVVQSRRLGGRWLQKLVMIPLNRLSTRDRRDAKETKANIPSVGEAKGFLSRIAVKCHLEISSSGNP